ncbi:MAG TPA: hypothetical protein VMV68_04525 [Spirochaetia bacterium]|nr:hypothetical protein [Spirochaetia bacterium]
MASCYFCGHELQDDTRIYRSSTCSSCGKDLKICLNCKFYEPGAHWDCHETIDELVADKERANFCSYFSLSAERRTRSGKASENAARSRLNDLFGNE